MKSEFSHNLRLKRLELNWSQEKVAKEISVKAGKRITWQAYQHWENGRRSPTPDMLVIIVEVLGIDDLYLFISKSNTTNCCA